MTLGVFPVTGTVAAATGARTVPATSFEVIPSFAVLLVAAVAAVVVVVADVPPVDASTIVAQELNRDGHIEVKEEKERNLGRGAVLGAAVLVTSVATIVVVVAPSPSFSSSAKLKISTKNFVFL